MSIKTIIILFVFFNQAICMERKPEIPWYSKLNEILVDLFYIKNEEKSRERPSQRESLQKTEDFAHIALFKAIAENNVKEVYSILDKNKVDLNFQEPNKKNTPVIAALINFKKRKTAEGSNEEEIKNACLILKKICDPAYSSSINLYLTNKSKKNAAKLAKKYAKELDEPFLAHIVRLVEFNVICAQRVEENMQRLRADPSFKKNFLTLTGAREPSFLTETKKESKDETVTTEKDVIAHNKNGDQIGIVDSVEILNDKKLS